MPRRNIIVILAVAALSLACYQAADHNPLGRSFAEIADLIERRYVGHVDRSALWSAAVRGMIDALNDPYSEYIDPKEAAELEGLLDQEFGGIGVEVGLEPETNRLTVISPIAGSPAYKAGILAGDVIAKIDGVTTADMKFSEVAQRLRGKPGTTVNLTIERAGQREPIAMPAIRRELIKVDSVLGDVRDGDDRWSFLLKADPKIGYVRIVNFGERTADELKAALTQLRAEGVQGVILDLRDDPGGLLSAAVDVCDLFLPEGSPIVTVRGRDDQIKAEYKAKGEGKFPDLPLAVLVNGHSASASEIVAACLQDDGRAAIIGQHTWGKGTVQNMIPLHSGQGMLKLTTADYWRPSGKIIQRPRDAKETEQWGVAPAAADEVKMSEEDWKQWRLWRRERDIVRPHGDAASGGASANVSKVLQHDPPLSRAVETIEAQLKASKLRPASSRVRARAASERFLSAFPPPGKTIQ